MSQAFRDAANGGTGASPMPVTVPGTVQPGDIILVFVSVDTQPSTFSVSTSGTTTPIQASLDASTATAFSLYKFAAATGDAGATLTFNATASSTPLVAVLLAYSGAALPQAGDVQSFSHTPASSVTSPSFTPAVAGSWGIAFGGIDTGSGTYSPGTLREADSFGVTLGYDSNGPASPVGGGTWTSGSSDVWWGYTVALPPPSAAAPPARPVIAPSLAAIQAACW